MTSSDHKNHKWVFMGSASDIGQETRRVHRMMQALHPGEGIVLWNWEFSSGLFITFRQPSRGDDPHLGFLPINLVIL